MKKFDPRWLPYMGALVQAVLFGIAGNRYFGDLAGWVIGLGVGAVVNPSLAYAASRYGDISEKRKPLARLALIGLAIVSPTTITLSLFAPRSIFTSIAWSVSVDLAIVLAGAIAGQSLMAQSEKKIRKKPTQQTARIRSAKGSKPLSEIACRFAGAGCPRKFKSQNAANAHARTCGFKPTIAMPVDVSRKDVNG